MKRENLERVEESAAPMKFIIHFEHQDGTEDQLTVSGATLEEIREQAGKELFRRTGTIEPRACWSEEISDAKS